MTKGPAVSTHKKVSSFPSQKTRRAALLAPFL